MSMYVVNILLRDAQPVALTYGNKNKADDVYVEVNTNPESVETFAAVDDYNQRVDVDRSIILGCVFVDIDKDFERQSEIQLLTARTQLRLQKMAAGDPTIKLLQSGGSLA